MATLYLNRAGRREKWTQILARGYCMGVLFTVKCSRSVEAIQYISDISNNLVSFSYSEIDKTLGLAGKLLVQF